MAAALLLDNGMGRVGAARTLVAMQASGCTVGRATPPTPRPAALPATRHRHRVRPARGGLSARPLAPLRRRQPRVGACLGLDPHRSDPAASRAARPLVGRGVYYEGFFVGEVAESAEGSRLLSGYRAKSSVQGSNPCLSATRP